MKYFNFKYAFKFITIIIIIQMMSKRWLLRSRHKSKLMCLVTQCKQNLTYLVSMIMKLYYFTTILVTKSILCSC